MRRVLVPARIDPRGPVWGGHVHSLEGRTMGTTWSVRWVDAPRTDLSGCRNAIEAELDAVVAEMSTWEPASDLSRFNAAPAGTWCSLPAACFDVLAAGLDIAARSAGAFDPAAGELVDLWGFGARRRHDEAGFHPPSSQEVQAALAHGGWRALDVDAAARRVRQPGGLRLDFSGIAKGHAVDRLALRLDALGFHDHLVEVGGELRGSGMKPDGQPWWIELQRPPAGPLDEAVQTLVALHGLSVATSGDYHRHYVWNGERHSHTIDPRLGQPVTNGVVSVSVLHAEAMHADAWATALTVLGADEALRMADREELAVLLVARGPDGRLREHPSAALEALAA